MLSSYQLVRVFAKPEEAQGNQAAVFYYEKNNKQSFEPSEVGAKLQKQKNITTTCFISQISDKHYDVSCFNGSREIQCCGHGMIAAAKIIFSTSRLSSITMNRHITASHNIDDKHCDDVVLSLPRLSAQLQVVPDWIGDAIKFGETKQIPDKAAVSEEDEGYLLLEFSPTLPLDVFRALQLDIQLVCESTGRAVVMVQFDQLNEHLYMRYFAPQYGVLEDIATGSVMRFVGDYIEQNYQCARFGVTQCSSKGGSMKIECKAEHILITANATIEKK